MSSECHLSAKSQAPFDRVGSFTGLSESSRVVCQAAEGVGPPEI